ncbi:reverse transcriptase [Apostichopus japonicus]|uniref:Reverse transcriptase n=1 Tax=Stichopus japonicus TaxID=307972 RepID=A0A2G8KIL7_STIJA|nr:reverse transcriptase [Apostichopus japonicus]
MEDSFSRSYEPEEAPITGGALPQELMARAADIFRRHLGFEEPETQPQKAGRVSKLTATGEMSSKPKTTMPVDATCYDRFEAIADKNRWTAFPARADRAVRVPDEAWRALFKCPTIPQEAKERLKAEHGASSSQTFKTPDQRKLEELLVEVDTAARSGMKFASVLMLSAEVLMRHHQQLPEDDSQVSRDEAGQLLLLLGPLVRLAYDQFARVATRSVKARRENVVSAIRWPSTEARNRMLALPVLGEDLFGGNFQKKLQEEVPGERPWLNRSLDPRLHKDETFRPRENKPTRGARAAPARPLSRGALRGRSRGRHTARPAPGHREEAEAQRLPDGTTTAPPLDRRSPPSPRGAHLTAAIPQVGGRLTNFTQQWEFIGGDKWVLDTVEHGYRIEFSSSPPFGGGGRQTPTPTDPVKRLILEGEILALLAKQAIVEVPGGTGPLLPSSFFLTKKRDDTWRPILNLKPLNTKFIRPKHFRMETLNIILPLLRKGMWAATVDLRDAYLHILVHKDHRRFLTFRYAEQDTDASGLWPAVRARYRENSGAVVSYLRRRGVTLYVYLDDWLVVGSSQSEAADNVHKTLHTLRELGWIVNEKKSRLSPTQTTQFLGAILDFSAGVARPSEERITAVRTTTQQILSHQESPKRCGSEPWDSWPVWSM